MTKLWQKNNIKLHPLIEKYTVGQDYLLDKTLMPYDIEATKAHVKGLQRIGILNQTEIKKLLLAFAQLKKDFQSGKISINVEDEDCHTVMENYLIKKLGDLGKKIHTGRSRNDQVLVALRLFMKDAITQISKQAKVSGKQFGTLAKKYKLVPMPGYSHSQQAMLISIGHYLMSFKESLADDIFF